MTPGRLTTSHKRLFKTTNIFSSQRPKVETSCKRPSLLSDRNHFVGRRFNTFSLLLTSSGRPFNNTSSVGDMLLELGWTSLQTRRQTLRLCMMYKIHKGLIAMDAQEFMTPLQRRSRHVNSYAYKIPHSKTDYHMYSFFPRTIREWNSLANETVIAPNLKVFKKSLPSD